jgi:sugar O-acyltransferase (sialic acid O-acetyltransferase NeuD family)
MATSRAVAQAADRGAGLSAAPLVVLGGGEHARVVIDAASSSDRWVVQGYAAPQASPAALTAPWLGDDAQLVARLADLPADERPWLVIGFGGDASTAGLARRTATADAFPSDSRWATIIHATAWVSPGATIEPGAVILAQAVVNHGAHVGRHAIINSGAIVEHDVMVGAGSHIAPGAVIGGGARIGRTSFVGLGSRIRDRVEIGDGVVVGMGAVVVASVVGGAQVVGIPARTSGTPPTDRSAR